MCIEIMYKYISTYRAYVCYCIGYTSDNKWSTSEIPLEQYQEKLIIRRKEALLEGIHIHTSLLYHNCVLINYTSTYIYRCMMTKYIYK